jgi:hypothetical protein
MLILMINLKLIRGSLPWVTSLQPQTLIIESDD